MRVNVYFNGNDIHDYALDCFAKGIEGHSVTNRKVTDYEPSDVAVIFGMRKPQVPISWPRGYIFERQRQIGKPVVVMDSGYIKRGDGPHDYYSVGLNGLNGRADFRNEAMPNDRRDKLGLDLPPWNSRGDFIILCGQVPWDASVQHIDEIYKSKPSEGIFLWYGDVIEEIAKHTERHIIFRPHPKAKKQKPGGVLISNKTLEEDFDRAHCFVTFNSNAAVDAAIQGIPIFAFDKGSMAFRIANTDLSNIESPLTPEREPWLNDLAYTQWTPDEMAEGQTWQHLFR